MTTTINKFKVQKILLLLAFIKQQKFQQKKKLHLLTSLNKNKLEKNVMHKQLKRKNRQYHDQTKTQMQLHIDMFNIKQMQPHTSKSSTLNCNILDIKIIYISQSIFDVIERKNSNNSK